MRGSYFMKIRLLAVMALVVVGAMAGTSPAMAAKKKAKTSAVSKSWQNQHKDNKVFGNAIHNLRVQSDKTNWDASQFSSFVITAATALQKGLTDLAASYSNFEYGVIQVVKPDGTAAAGSFLATPRIDPTVEQSTVTGQFAVAGAGNHTLKVAVRSVNPEANDKTSTVACRVTGSIPSGGFITSKANAALSSLPFYPVARSPIQPTNKAELPALPVSMVSTDTQVDLTTAGNSSGALTAAGATAAGTGVLHVTLSCVSVPKS